MTPKMAIFKVPDEVTDSMAAGVNCALAQVIMGLERVAVGFGDRVVIQGAGGLGVYAAAVARERGAAQVVVIDGIDERLELAKEMGADAVVDLRELSTPAQRIKRVREVTDGGGDVVCELVGRAAAMSEGLQMLAPAGRYLEIGTFYPGTTTSIDPGMLVMRNLRIEAVAFYNARSLRDALTFLERHALDLPFEHTVADYPLEAINEAFADQIAGRVARASLVMA